MIDERLQDVRRRVNHLPAWRCGRFGWYAPTDQPPTNGGRAWALKRLYANSLDAVSDRDFCR